MLKSLLIKNYAIIDEAKLDFDNGFNVITGETGAGKSILLGALGLILGKRADTKVLYDTTGKCIAEATFQIDQSRLSELPTSDNYDISNEIILRREINNNGKSRAFINDTPVNLSDLKELAFRLVDIHNQFDTLSITSTDYQREIIDIYSGNKAEKERYQKTYQEFVSLKQELNKLKLRQNKGQEDLEFLLFQLDELNKISLDKIDQNQLEEEYQTLSNSEEIQRVLYLLQNELTESDFSLESRLLELNREINHISSYAKSFNDLSERFERMIEDFQDIARECNKLIDQVDHDPERVIELKETLNHLYSLEKKHRVQSVEELISLREDFEIRTSGTLNLDETIKQKENALVKCKKDLWSRAEELTIKRQSCFNGLENKIEELLNKLAIPNAKIIISLTELPDFEETGLDHIDLKFSSNKGVAPLSIEGVASGGELSRLALSVKSIMAAENKIPTLIFDEIDTGISGAVAVQLANILEDLSSVHQVICITHSPQVASTAGKHFYIHKKDTAERTITQVKVLSADNRIQEIAKMLSTDPPSVAALENAKELLNN